METKIFILKLLSLFVLNLCIIMSNGPDIESIVCPIGYFRVGTMKSCHQLLDCSDYEDMTPIVLLNRGFVKNIFLFQWNNNFIIVSNLSHYMFSSDFQHNLQMLRQLSVNPLIIQLIGSCNNDMLFTEYHSYGDANQLPLILKQNIELNDISIKFKLCLNYVQILVYLHNSPIGTRVMCDSNSLEKTLSQYLLTNELTLVLNDLDALPEVIPGLKGIKCGRRQLFGSFVAPEQLWPKPDEEFRDEEMPEYDHKTDIWKIPDICLSFLTTGMDFKSSASVKLVTDLLTDIHNQCKRIDPQTRPTAEEVLRVYENIFQKLF